MEKIDWDKCYKDLKKLQPCIESDLVDKIKSELNNEFEVNICSGNYPPNLMLMPHWKDPCYSGLGRGLQGDKKKEDKVRDLIIDVCKKYNVNCKPGLYVPKEKGGNKFSYDKTASDFTATLDFSKYKKD